MGRKGILKIGRGTYEDTEPLNSDELSLPVEAALLPPTQKITSTLPEEAAMASPEELVLKGTDDFP